MRLSLVFVLIVPNQPFLVGICFSPTGLLTFHSGGRTYLKGVEELSEKELMQRIDELKEDGKRISRLMLNLGKEYGLVEQRVREAKEDVCYEGQLNDRFHCEEIIERVAKESGMIVEATFLADIEDFITDHERLYARMEQAVNDKERMTESSSIEWWAQILR